MPVDASPLPHTSSSYSPS